MSLNKRVALVTGSGRGIGRGIALALAEDGADVAVNYHNDESAAMETVERIRAFGCRANCYKASVADYDQSAAMVEQVKADLGPIAILVNNAGIASRGRSVVDSKASEVQRVVATHAFASHYLSSLVLPAMRALDRGDIVMISSSATRSYSAFGAPYNMAKAAMEALAFTIAKEERSHGIRVNVVAPGLVETEMGRRLVRANTGKKDIRDLDAMMPFGRVCQVEDVANVVRYLVSDANSYVTGERIYCDGGGGSAAAR